MCVVVPFGSGKMCCPCLIQLFPYIHGRKKQQRKVPSNYHSQKLNELPLEIDMAKNEVLQGMVGWMENQNKNEIQ